MTKPQLRPPTPDDILSHSWAEKEDILRWISEVEKTPGKFSHWRVQSDPETAVFGVGFLVATIVIGLIVSIPVGILIAVGGGLGWLYLYLCAAPTAFIASLFGVSIIIGHIEAKRRWASMTRFARYQSLRANQPR